MPVSRGYAVSTYLPAPVAEALDRAVEDTQLPRNHILRELIAQGLEAMGYIKPSHTGERSI